MKIMLIDDDKDSLQSMSDGLTLNGYETVEFLQAKDAIAAYSPQEYDIVITDYQMPEINGLELCKTIYAKNPRAYLILVSGYMEGERICPDAQGFYAWFQKPLNIDRFMQALQEIEEKMQARL